MMKELNRYKVGKLYIGSDDWYEFVVVDAYNEQEACNRAAGYLKPNYMQTLKCVKLKMAEKD